MAYSAAVLFDSIGKNMQFRSVQGLAVGTMLLYWLVRCATHPHWHTTMLIMAVLVAASSEVGYRAGLYARKDAERSR